MGGANAHTAAGRDDFGPSRDDTGQGAFVYLSGEC